MKTYTITTDDNHAIMRAAQADSLAWIVWEMDQNLHHIAKHGEGYKQVEAERWRERLGDFAADHGVVIDGLFE